MDGCCQLKFVVELATREDSHKKLTKQPVTLRRSDVLRLHLHSLPLSKPLTARLRRSIRIIAALWHLSHTNTKNLHSED
jgi:hypothetical protein